MFQHGAGAGGLPDLPRAFGRQRGEMIGDILSVAGHQHLLIGRQEHLYALPGVGDQAGSGPGRFEHARGGREADLRHAVARDVEHRERRAVEGIMFGRVDMAAMADIGGHRLAFPAIAANQEAAVGQQRGGLEKIFLHSRFPVGQAIAEESEIAGEARIGRDGEMGVGIERVIDGDAFARAHCSIGRDDRIAAAIGEDKVDLRQHGADGMRRIGAHFVQRRGGIDIPENAQGIGTGALHDAGDQVIVEHAHAARLDHDIGVGGFVHDAGEALDGGGIDGDARPVGRIDIAMLLPIESVGFVETDVMAATGQFAQDAAIIGGGAVPVGGEEAGSVKGDFHAAGSMAGGAAS